jgi:peptidase E
MTIRRILATSGGFLPTDRWGVMTPGPMLLDALRRTGAQRPRVCLVMTASGDDASYLARSYAALGSVGCDVDHLSLFTMPNRDPEQILARSDLVWVGGGSVANLLAVWRLHGVDTAMQSAWDRGTILAGVSAGSICWHIGGPTDSFGPELRVVTDGLGLIPFGNGVHYDSEQQRRPLLQRSVADGLLPVSYATDDRVGIWYEEDRAVEVVTDVPDTDPATGPAAYLIESQAGEAVETRLPPGPIG